MSRPVGQSITVTGMPFKAMPHLKVGGTEQKHYYCSGLKADGISEIHTGKA